MCDWTTTSANLSTEDSAASLSLGGDGDCDFEVFNSTPTQAPSGMRVPLSAFPEYTASQAIYQWNLWIFWVLGLVGNSAALLTLRRLKPFTSVFIYIGCLAVSDIVYLTVKLAYEQMRTNLQRLGVFGCGPLLFVLHWTGKTSHWIVLFMTIDRLIAICFPFKASQLSTKKTVSFAMVGLVAFQALVNCHYFFSNEQTTRGGAITCGTKPEYKEFRSNTVWFFFALSSIIPCGGVLVMNTVMAVRLCQTTRTQGRLSSDDKKTPNRQSRKVTLMLMTVSIAFLVLVTPGPVFYMYLTYWNFRVDQQTTAIYYLARELVNACINADHAINFFLYFLSGSKFRESFLGMLRCGKSSVKARQARESSAKTALTETGAVSTTNFSHM